MGQPAQIPLLSHPSDQPCPNWGVFPHKRHALYDQRYQQPKLVCSTSHWKRQKAVTHSVSSLCWHLVTSTMVPAPSTKALLSAFPFSSLLAQLEPGVKALLSSSITTVMAYDLFSKVCHPVSLISHGALWCPAVFPSPLQHSGLPHKGEDLWLHSVCSRHNSTEGRALQYLSSAARNAVYGTTELFQGLS